MSMNNSPTVIGHLDMRTGKLVQAKKKPLPEQNTEPIEVELPILSNLMRHILDA